MFLILSMLFLVFFVVETLLAHRSGKHLATDAHTHLRAEGGIAAVDEGETHAAVGGDCVVAGGHNADCLSVGLHLIASAWDGAVVKLDAHHLLRHSFGFLLGARIAAYELRFVEFHKHTQPCHYR